MTIRIYGKVMETWTSINEKGRETITQEELAYKEYDVETLNLIGIGSEDFSPERRHAETEKRWVWTWDGKKRNKGGFRWFECQGMTEIRKSEKKAVKAYFKKKYGAELIELR